MDRRRFLLTSLAGALAAPLGAGAQAGKVYRIGFLGAGTRAGWGPNIEALQLGLRDHGYVDGRDFTIEYRWAENRFDRLPELAAELVRLNPDVIITHGTPCTLALKRATSTIPIVMSIIGNPVENGVVSSLARPGGNITGSSFFSDEVTAKRLEILHGAKSLRARVRRVEQPATERDVTFPAHVGVEIRRGTVTQPAPQEPPRRSCGSWA
jgi:putative ABC transport system substrate-binding protein